MKLTAKAVEKLRHNGALHFSDVKDDLAAGLYLRLLASGGKRWVLRYKVNRRTRVATLGDAAEIGLAEARDKASEWRRLVREGRDPAAEVLRATREARLMPTVEDFVSEYIERHAKPNKRSWREDDRLLRREVVPTLGRLRLDHVHRRDVIAVVDGIRDRGAQVLSNRTLAVVRRMFRLAVERGVIETSPVTHVAMARESPRERVLSDGEIRRLWQATDPGYRPQRPDDPPAVQMLPSTRLAIRLLLLTGAREGEVCGIERSEVDLESRRWLLPAERSKNRLSHVVPLSVEAIKTLREALELSWSVRWVFPASRGNDHLTGYGLTQAIARIFHGQAGRPRIHDLRRTAGTRLSELGVARSTVDKVLNHKDRTVGGIYDRHSYDPEKRQALEAWERKLAGIVAAKVREDNIVALAQRVRG